jgi:cytochrome c-type biogenesis protein CcmH/NrfG
MPKDGPSKDHLAPEDVAGFIEGMLGRRRRHEVEEHLDECPDCVEYLGAALRSARPMTEQEEESLGQIPARSPEELLQSLRPLIVATSPGSASRLRRPGWKNLLPAAAAVATLVVAFMLIQSYVIGPARGRRLTDAAIRDLVTLRQGTGRVPLRYIPELQRATVTRSAFDTDDPAEVQIEMRLRKAVELAPAQAASHIGLGLFLLDTGNLLESENEFRLALDIEPDSTPAINGLAVIRYMQALAQPNRSLTLRREGLALLRQAQRQSPADPQVAFNIALFYQELGSLERARNSWRSYLELDSGSEWARIALENFEKLSGR